MRSWTQNSLDSFRRLGHGQRGALLMETVVTVAVLGIVGTAVLGAVQTSYIGKRNFDVQSTAENTIRNQMDSVFREAYKAPDAPDPTYVQVAVPADYSVTAESVIYNATSTDISTVRITVSHNGQVVKVYETLRTNN